MKPKVGVFICHCGTNIAGVVDVKRVREYAAKLPNVSVAEDYIFMCSELGQNLIKSKIKELGLNKIVVASCSPKLHEPTFRRCIEEAGLNPFLLEMANLREHCSWAHMREPERATEKAKFLVEAATMKAALLEPIEVVEGSVAQRTLVIGGGVAGIQAALDLADQGFKVYLVEKTPSIGGNMANLVKTFPTDDCAMCILSPRMNEVRAHPNIEIFAYSEVKEVKGFIGDFKVKVLRKPRYVDEGKCTGCGLCKDSCPVIVPSEFDFGMGFRKAIYIPFPQAVPLRYTIDMDHCIRCGMCKRKCPSEAIDFDQKPVEVELSVGTIIVATGWDEWDPTPLKQYGYGRYENVITQMELARLIDPLGPTLGEIVRADGEPAHTIVMIQCVGSRDEEYNRYCSGVCCMAALKNAQLIKIEHAPEAEIYVCYIDIRTNKKDYEEYYDRARDYGINFIRGKVSRVEEDPKTKRLKVYVYHTLLNMNLEIDADLVVLSAATVPSEGTAELAHVLGIDAGPGGFLKELHPKLKPVETKIDGIFICGVAQGPKDIPDSVAQGSAAASKASVPMSKGKVTIPLLAPEVVKDLCVACGICVDMCPFDAVSVNEEKKVAEINPLKCKGCGSCAAECPTGALQLRHYKDEQMLVQVAGILGKGGSQAGG